MPLRLYLLFFALVCTPALAESDPGALAKYEDRVGHAFAYAKGPDSSSRYCKKTFVDLSTAVDERLADWMKRNDTVLREIGLHWDGMVKRAAQSSSIAHSKFYEALELQNDQMLLAFLKKSEEQSAGYSRAYCEALATTMLKDARFQLEQALREPLQVLRTCGTAAYCPKITAAQ